METNCRSSTYLGLLFLPTPPPQLRRAGVMESSRMSVRSYVRISFPEQISETQRGFLSFCAHTHPLASVDEHFKV